MDLSYYHAKLHPKRASRFLQTSKSVLGWPNYLQAVPGAPRSDGQILFLVYTYVGQEDVAKISKVPGARAM